MEQPTAIPAPAPPKPREIRPLDAKKFGEKGELKEKLLTILKEVPALHERLKVAATEFERLNKEFKDATDRAQTIVDEWERLDREEKGKAKA